MCADWAFSISDQKSIAELIEQEDLHSQKNRQKLLQEVEDYIKKMTIDTNFVLKSRHNPDEEKKKEQSFFRTQDHYDNTILILQYLLAFWKKIPTPIEISREPVNPFMQFKSFVKNSLNLLKEENVRQRILHEVNIDHKLSDQDLQYHKIQIEKCWQELSALEEKAKAPIEEHFFYLFKVLHRLSLFWFSVRHQDMQKVRRADIFIYKLSLILLEKTKKS